MDYLTYKNLLPIRLWLKKFCEVIEEDDEEYENPPETYQESARSRKNRDKVEREG